RSALAVRKDAARLRREAGRVSDGRRAVPVKFPTPAAACLLAAGALGAVRPSGGSDRTKPAARLKGEPAAKVRAEFDGICRNFLSGSNSFYGRAQIEDLRRRLAAPAVSAEQAVTV